jgi:polysaccharide pyruvyl transferase WcaK-like protein
MKRSYRNDVEVREGDDFLSKGQIGMIRANYGHKGDFAIVKGTLNAFKEVGVHVSTYIDPDISFPEYYFKGLNSSVIRTWPSIFQQNVIPGKGLRRRAWVRALLHWLTYRPRVNFDFDLLWYTGGVRFGAMISRYPIAELVALHYYKHLFRKRAVLGGVSIAKGEGVLSKLYTNSLYRRAIMNADYIFARDKQTFNFLKTLGFPIDNLSFICDFAFFLDPRRTAKTDEISSIIREYERPIGIVPDVSKLKNPNIGFNNKCFRRLLTLIRKLREEGFSIFLIPLSHTRLANTPPYTQDDYEVCNEVNRILKASLPIIQIEDLEPEEIISIMSELDCVFSVGRVHGAVLGSLANTYTIHIYFEEKSLMFKDLFGDFPLIHYHSWLLNSRIDDEIVSQLKDRPTINYGRKINLWRKQTLKEVKCALQKLDVL